MKIPCLAFCLLLAVRGGAQSIDVKKTDTVVTPAAVGTPTIVLLGSSDFSAQLAGLLGLPFAFAHHFDTGGTLLALDVYRQHFAPSAVLDQPYAIVTAAVVVAPNA